MLVGIQTTDTDIGDSLTGRKLLAGGWRALTGVDDDSRLRLAARKRTLASVSHGSEPTSRCLLRFEPVAAASVEADSYETYIATGIAGPAGYVDTAGYLALQGLFTAHVTGNFVTIGASLISGTSGTVATAEITYATARRCSVNVAARRRSKTRSSERHGRRRFAAPRTPKPRARSGGFRPRD